MPKKAAGIISKAIKSAAANAEDKSGGDASVENLRIHTIAVDGGTIQKRWMPRSMGRANRINHRSQPPHGGRHGREVGTAMGQKTHPIGFRLGIIKTWSSRWYEEKNYAKWLHEDLKLKDFIKKKLQPRRRQRTSRSSAPRTRRRSTSTPRVPASSSASAARASRPSRRTSRRSPRTRSSSTSSRSARPRPTRSLSPRTSRRSSSAASPSAAP